MALTKTLQSLIERAECKGSAVKRVREGFVMGNGYGSYESAKRSPMINQWKVIIEGNTVTVEHYDTVIFKYKKGGVVLEWYGESNTDRDALNGLCDYYHLPYRFSYRPANGGFQLAQ